ncbi:MAG: hypothetical protein E7582_05460 [Ruminococcaceae bacterium]|nr:hypothetical protein [Oscillospiraceae bacterium]
MSKYTFKRKEVVKKEVTEERIMNASATPEESTAVFVKTEVADKIKHSESNRHIEDDNSFFNPFEELNEVKKKHSSFLNLSSFIKKKDTQEVQEDEQEEIKEKVRDIYASSNISVDEIKQNLSSGKKISLSEVFSDKKSVDDKTNEDDDEPENVSEGFDLDNDTYDIESPSLDEEEDVYAISESDDDEELPIEKPIKKVKTVREVLEYKSPDDKEEFTELYRKKGQTSLLLLILSSILTLLLIYLETKTLPHPEWLTPGKFGILYLLLDLQLVFLSAVCIINPLINGAKQLFIWRPNKNSISFVSFVIAVLQIFLHLFLGKYNKEITLYSSIFAFTSLLTCLVSYIDIRREHISFRVAASSKNKYAVSSLDETSAEFEKFNEVLPEDAGIYKIGKTKFISNFFKNTAKSSPFNEMYKISLPLVLLASLVFSILTVTVGKEAGATSFINNFTLLFMMSLPLSAIFTVSLPFFFTTLKLNRRGSALIGENAIQKFADTSLISFADTDVFHEKGIKITSMKSYGKTRIDNIYLITAKVFDLVGGPLKAVFNRSVIATRKENCDDCIYEVTSNGIKAKIDSFEVLVGNKDYMSACGLTENYDDAIDRTFETQNGRIMYVAIDGEISAKFYVKYAFGRNFKAILDSFYDIGICMAINSRDPNLDTKFVTQILKDENYPIVVVKREDIPIENNDEVEDSCDSSIVSATSVANMLRSFLSADKLLHIISINTLTKYISLIFALAVVIVAFLVDGSHEKITPLFIMLYQFIWTLPVVGTSMFD